jgi:hypothetical protein
VQHGSQLSGERDDVAVVAAADRLGQCQRHHTEALRKRMISNQMIKTVLDHLDQAREVLAVADRNTEGCRTRTRAMLVWVSGKALRPTSCLLHPHRITLIDLEGLLEISNS